MIAKLRMARPFLNVPKRSNICPECGEAQVMKWDSVDDGRNITLVSSNHRECLEKYWKNIKEFDYQVTIKEKKLEKVA